MKIKVMISGIIGAITPIVYSLFGEWSSVLTTLLIFMLIDYITGFVVAAVFHKSTKTTTGGLDSRAGLKGIFKKGAMLLIIIVANRIGIIIAQPIIKEIVALTMLVNESISILENISLMGVPMPNILIKALDLLQKK